MVCGIMSNDFKMFGFHSFELSIEDTIDELQFGKCNQIANREDT